MIQYNEEKKKELSEIAAKNGGLCEALWNCACGNGFYYERREKLWKLLERAVGRELTEVKTVEEFWKPGVESAVCELVGDAMQKDFVEMMQLQMECQFSWTICRRSYRTRDFGWHASKLVYMLVDWISYTVCDKSVEEMLQEKYEDVRGYEMFLALQLRRENETVLSAVREAILGDNQEVLLTRTIIRAIIISGREDLLELLLKLLSAARLQEGLRQQILENADAGSMQTLKRILKFCIDEDMFRYSSTIRAFNTWTGLGYGDEKQATIQKYALIAYECLDQKDAREKYIESHNNLEAYLGLWAMASEDMNGVDRYVIGLLDAKEKYRRILGWYFITHSDSSHYRMQVASCYLTERDPEILAWILGNLEQTSELVYGNLAQTSELVYAHGVYYPNNRKRKAVVNEDLPSRKEERKWIFLQLKELVKVVGTKDTVFTGNPFPFSWIRFESEKVINCMMSLAGYDMDSELIRELHSCVTDMTPQQRRTYYLTFLWPETDEQHKVWLLEALSDKSVQVKELAVEILTECPLTEAELDLMMECLKSKSSNLRKSVVVALKRQEPKAQAKILQKLFTSGDQFQIQAGTELLLELKEKEPELVAGQTENIAALRQQKLSTQTEILLEQLEGSDQAGPVYSAENGYGLYDPAVIEEVLSRAEEQFEGKALTEQELTKMLAIDKKEYFAVLERMNDVFNRHADYEYETMMYDGSVKKVLFGDADSMHLWIPIQDGEKTCHTYVRQLTPETFPFFEEFRESLGEYARDVTKMLSLSFLASRWRPPYYQHGDDKVQPWFHEFVKLPMLASYHQEGREKYKFRYFHFQEIIEVLPQLFPAQEVFEASFQIMRGIIRFVETGFRGKNDESASIRDVVEKRGYANTTCLMNRWILGHWRSMLSSYASTPEDFKRWFYAEYYLEKVASKDGLIAQMLTQKDFFRAHQEGFVPVDVFYANSLEAAYGGVSYLAKLGALTNPNSSSMGREIYELYPEAKEIVKKLVLRIVEVEEKRGEMPTPLTFLARSIERFEGGAEHFVKLLAALGNENFFRGYLYRDCETKQAILSLLLKRCYPTKEDGPEQLKKYLKQTDITEKRLVEAVMYAPQWAGLAEQVTGWKGLKCGIWFFHAHVNETFSAEKETEVALYSPIPPQRFNDGAFDRDWFWQAYQMLGEKRFRTLYKCAKYITSGSNLHRRSQLYADAALGKLDADSIKAEIIEKRNQEKLRCYPLIPIPESDVKTALERYEFIQKFLKESRQFGAQRRENERKACNAALENLAITTGFYDVNRMTWFLESEKVKELRALMEPKELSGIHVWVDIDEEGIAALAVEKDGTRQKSLPKELNKAPLILELKEAIKELKEQRRRAKEILERAMTECTLFSGEELQKISENPILLPLVQKLVWVRETEEKKEALIGFLKKGERLVLEDVSGVPYPLEETWKLRVAHPHDMMHAGVWSEFMHLLYREKVTQPFKQVFREYYPITEDELQERTISRRYAGHQVQPRKTVALLRSRGWTVDYEEGLQKVFYKEDLVVRMFAMADWFSPSDIEAPTLEEIRFFHRNTYKSVEFTEVPPIVFSEVMRDIDLVVSVAHVGGVDPEASHSTVEMRTAIAAELIKLLKLSNVTFIGAHAKIIGSLANYSVHMGSGVVHAEAIGMLNILPVHSQARGRIFLPFADEDPKTAEIMSKIILLSEDKKIKDPSVLQQLR